MDVLNKHLKKYLLLLCTPLTLCASGCNLVRMSSLVSSSIPFPKVPYTSTYEQKSDTDKISYVTVSSNGNGYMLQISKGDKDTCSIFDNVDKKMYFFNLVNKSVESWPLQYVATPWMYDEGLYKASPFVGKQIEEQTVDGRRCNVWLFENDRSKTRTKSYFDKETGCLVLSNYESSGKSGIQRLTKYSPTSMPASAFQIPDDYKLTIMGSHTL